MHHPNSPLPSLAITHARPPDCIALAPNALVTIDSSRSVLTLIHPVPHLTCDTAVCDLDRPSECCGTQAISAAAAAGAATAGTASNALLPACILLNADHTAGCQMHLPGCAPICQQCMLAYNSLQHQSAVPQSSSCISLGHLLMPCCHEVAPSACSLRALLLALYSWLQLSWLQLSWLKLSTRSSSTACAPGSSARFAWVHTPPPAPPCPPSCAASCPTGLPPSQALFPPRCRKNMGVECAV